MNNFYGYVRVSTARQGEEGVSLQEQRAAIAHYAERSGLRIVEWFEERETAAHVGRRVFTRMLKLLRAGRADGVVLHKIDRGARNLRDWIELIALSEEGSEVRFTTENLDLRSRGGRLAADIQAVVAADYIRNLREETRKGFYGRLKQGLYPLPAPLGYLNRGKGRPKEPDPGTAPLVREAFELYATGRYGLYDLLSELHTRGLRNRRGGRVSRNGLSLLLNNPFYVGLMRLRNTGETFPGAHEPLVSTALFEAVQDVLHGRAPNRTVWQPQLFTRLFACAGCGYSVIAERQKGRLYYRCHTRTCKAVCVREDVIEHALLQELSSIRLNEDFCIGMHDAVSALASRTHEESRARIEGLQLELAATKDRLRRLTDAFVDGLVEKALFEDRKMALFLRQREIGEQLAAGDHDAQAMLGQVRGYLELAQSASNLYEKSAPAEKRELVLITTSNRMVCGKRVDVTLAPGFRLIAEYAKNANGSPYRDEVRTFEELARKLLAVVLKSKDHRLSSYLKQVAARDKAPEPVMLYRWYPWDKAA